MHALAGVGRVGVALVEREVALVDPVVTPVRRVGLGVESDVLLRLLDVGDLGVGGDTLSAWDLRHLRGVAVERAAVAVVDLAAVLELPGWPTVVRDAATVWPWFLKTTMYSPLTASADAAPTILGWAAGVAGAASAVVAESVSPAVAVIPASSGTRAVLNLRCTVNPSDEHARGRRGPENPTDSGTQCL